MSVHHSEESEWLNERGEWLEALDAVMRERGVEYGRELVLTLQQKLSAEGHVLAEAALNTPYRNTISVADEPVYPGQPEIEERLENLIRWNAIAMVLQAQDSGAGVGGHIATYLSASTIMEVGLQHVFRADVDKVNFQPHAAPGVYARAWLEGRLSESQLKNFRRELADGGGLPSYPHPRRLPDFWEMPCASMGLSTPTSLYQARFARYLENRGLIEPNGGKFWTFIGDGESDEPEVLGTIDIAAREKLDNFVLVVNCNLQRLDGPVRGNGKIIQELERSFRGADWHVIKVIWGSGWDALLARDAQGSLQRRMDEAVDGDYQYYTASAGNIVREHWVEDDPVLAELMKTLSDEEIRTIKRGGHDRRKIFAALQKAREVTGKPVVILLKTVKGDGLGPRNEGANTIHQKKNIAPDERYAIAQRLGIPITEEEAKQAKLYKPEDDSELLLQLHESRARLGGYLPSREVKCPALPEPSDALFADLYKGSGERSISTTMSIVRLLAKLLRDRDIGRYIVPIVPDEARTFGMDGLFPQAGIYSPAGQRYQPVDAGTIAPYKESADGQILQEGICETGAMASFLAAGMAYANHGLPMIPFYIFYSMFGLQRVGDMIWAGGDGLTRGFLLGGTSGRTTLNGEGVQHQDGHSLILASTVPNLKSYDPAFAFELAVIVKDGIRRMYSEQEDCFYYITVTNQNLVMPAMPEGSEEGICRGIYCFERDEDAQVHLLSSGAIMIEAQAAATKLRAQGARVAIWSVTSFGELHRDVQAVQQRAFSAVADVDSPEDTATTPYVAEIFAPESGVFVVATDYMKSLADWILPWLPGPTHVLGTDGYGLSDSRAALRDYFEVDSDAIVRTVQQLQRGQAS